MAVVLSAFHVKPVGRFIVHFSGPWCFLLLRLKNIPRHTNKLFFKSAVKQSKSDMYLKKKKSENHIYKKPKQKKRQKNPTPRNENTKGNMYPEQKEK